MIPGNYTITILNSNDNLLQSNQITILPTLICTNETILQEGFYKVKVLDGQGNPTSGETVHFNINGNNYVRTTGPDGYARIQIWLTTANSPYTFPVFYYDSYQFCQIHV